MHVTILLCTLAAVIGLPVGYYIGWEAEELARWFDERMDREWDLHPVCAWEGWR